PGGIEHCQREAEPAKGNQAPGLNFGCELTCDRSFYEQDEAPRGKSQTSEFGCVTQKCLQKLRHQHQAAEQQDTKHEQHQTRTGEVEILEHMDINYWRFLKPFPNDQGNQTHG